MRSPIGWSHRSRRTRRQNRNRGLRNRDVRDRRVDRSARPGLAGRAARLRVPVRARAHPHAGRADDPAPARLPARRAQAHARPTRRTHGGGDGDDARARRHGNPARPPARPDRAREGDRLARPRQQRSRAIRGRRRLERRRDAQPRHGPRDALRVDARARAGDARDLDRGRARVPRRARRLRPDLVVAEAACSAASPC